MYSVIRPDAFPYPHGRRKDILPASRENLPTQRLLFHMGTRRPLPTGHAKGRLKVYSFFLPILSCYKFLTGRTFQIHSAYILERVIAMPETTEFSKNNGNPVPIFQNFVSFRKYTVNKLLGKCTKPFHPDGIVSLLLEIVNGLLTHIYLNFKQLINFLTIPIPLISIMNLYLVKKTKTIKTSNRGIP